ncbi:tRNA (adenine-N1)-methyltransferase [Thermanaerovibrio acidaminovorans]|jgi:tRNA (adenine57-N1/adenine58-N1)-methyltransferase|uniref:tRNA (adenine(58)-N(1))-methyltransferase TrmI n=1 Tax=Thermanaerovibrio acidaminovorans (strain ATCC 49978 / DSM 6589 / Su883) TaxID=525903 RepID=D1B5S0_THEAS|nr:tRNA (adenine-N1)-methyltransferase [Thermanaerovibrio acidaminovorans]ACZ19361.1 tRNA (adenine-N(1)-)-methyltransferase [Thermanaerovibrio acidaminovorans DSM 6589]
MLNYGDLVFLWSPRKGDSFLLKLSKGAVQGSRLGQLRHDDFVGHDYGDVVRSHSGEAFALLRPTLGEYTRRIKRNTQIVFPKEAGFVLMHLNIGPGSRVVECGTGSGGLTCVFAHFVGDEGHVYTYDRRQEFSELAMRNAERWGVADRISFKVRSLDEGFDERDVDAVFLDLPTPWDYIDKAREALAPGNRIAILVPTFNQIERTLDALRDNHFADPQVLEILLRYLKTDPRRIRPEDMMVGHTGYLIFASKSQEGLYDGVEQRRSRRGEDGAELEETPEA